MPTQILKVPITAVADGTGEAYSPPIASRWVSLIKVDIGTFTGVGASLKVSDELTGVLLVNDTSGIADSVTPGRFPLHTIACAVISGIATAFRTPSRLRIEVADVTADQAGEVEIHVQSTPPSIV